MSAGASSEIARVGRLAVALRERELDVLLVAAPVNLRYLSGFTGSNGLALIAAAGGRRAPLLHGLSLHEPVRCAGYAGI